VVRTQYSYPDPCCCCCLKVLADSLRPHVIPGPRKYYSWGETLVPDVWFDPTVVSLVGQVKEVEEGRVAWQRLGAL
jgi:hypothetical protein